jgi:hypothetical protein
MLWILVILFTSGPEGGAAIDTHLSFGSQSDCQIAAKAVRDSQTEKNPYGMSFGARTAISCVKVK